MVEQDHMAVGDLIPLEGEWFMDRHTKVKFRFNEEGKAVNEQGDLLMPVDEQMTDPDEG